MTVGPRRRLVAVVAAGLLPWTILFIGDELTVLFTFGLFNTNPPQLVSIVDYLVRYTDALPSFIESWGTGVLLYLLALGSAASGVFWREDHRITALALLGAALSQVGVAVGFSRRMGTLALPLGTIGLLAVAWWYYWPLVRPVPEKR